MAQQIFMHRTYETEYFIKCQLSITLDCSRHFRNLYRTLIKYINISIRNILNKSILNLDRQLYMQGFMNQQKESTEI